MGPDSVPSAETITQMHRFSAAGDTNRFFGHCGYLRVLEIQEIKTVPYVPLLASVRGETNRNAAGTTWTKRYSEPQRIWSRNSAFSRIISIDSVCSEGRLPDPEEAPTPLKFIHIGGSNTVAPLPKRIGADPEIRQ
jgi:hypothetical protein